MTLPSPGEREPAAQPFDAAVPPSNPAMPLLQSEPSAVKRSAAANRPQTRVYPLLLFLSTALAAVFCFMYITKPEFPLAPPLGANPLATADKPTEVAATPATTQPLTTAAKSTATKPAPPPASMLPDTEHLPGDPAAAADAAKPAHDSDPRRAHPEAAPAPIFEETNLHIQHVLTAATPGGDLSRIVLNVPVLYQSRNLGWSENQVAESRDLLKRLAAYQENSRALREEAITLLAAWNHLVERSIPTAVLRADSPSLPANQEQADRTGQATGLDTTESIQLQPADK